jgi:hypothetical protein
MVKGKQLCKHCYQDYLAPKVLQRYVDDFTTPYSYNTALFDLLASTIVWESVTEKEDRKFKVFGRFLQTQKLSEPLTWTTIVEALPTLGSTNRTQPKLVRACLLELGHLLVASGQLESWEDYVANRSALQPIKRAPEAMQGFLHRYTAWLWERRTAPSNVRDHLQVLSSFWLWCEARGIASPEEVQEALVNDYLLTLYWQWQCSACQGAMTFEPHTRKAPHMCASCGTIGSLTKQKRFAQNMVRQHRAKLRVFFDWLKINRLVVTNPVQRKTPAPNSAIQHYPPEVIKQLCTYITASDSEPFEAVILYLIIFHALSVWELRHVMLPTAVPLRQEIVTPGLAEAYYVIVPRPEPTRGDRSPGRPDIHLDFPAQAAPWLKPLLMRFERQRQQTAERSKNRYLLTIPSTARHNTPVSQFLIWKTVSRASLRVLGAACNPNVLRKTAGVMFADRAGAGVLRWMGWNDDQAFEYAWAAREVIQPQQIDGSRSTHARLGVEPITFPSPKEQTRKNDTRLEG